MSSKAYYNEFDVKAAAWLRELIKAGHIAPGDVDDRPIQNVRADDLRGYTQCHFFAGIGGWSYALRLAGWPDDRPVWTGSCPCQPFSAAGRRGGIDDARHLWPEFYKLIGERRPATVFGEQVASKDGLAWLDIVSTDLERAHYAVGAADMCAAGVGAPHIRQRLYFVADSNRAGLEISGAHEQRTKGKPATVACGGLGELAEPQGKQHDGRGHARAGRRQSTDGSYMGDAVRERQQGGWVQLRRPEHQRETIQHQSVSARSSSHSDLGDSAGKSGEWDARTISSAQGRVNGAGKSEHGRQPERPANAGHSVLWAAAEYIPCTDGKARPIESGTFPLAHGVPHRVGLLRGYGNAIVPQVAAEFIGAYLDAS